MAATALLELASSNVFPSTTRRPTPHAFETEVTAAELSVVTGVLNVNAFGWTLVTITTPLKLAVVALMLTRSPTDRLWFVVNVTVATDPERDSVPVPIDELKRPRLQYGPRITFL